MRLGECWQALLGFASLALSSTTAFTPPLTCLPGAQLLDGETGSTSSRQIQFATDLRAAFHADRSIAMDAMLIPPPEPYEIPSDESLEYEPPPPTEGKAGGVIKNHSRVAVRYVAHGGIYTLFPGATTPPGVDADAVIFPDGKVIKLSDPVLGEVIEDKNGKLTANFKINPDYPKPEGLPNLPAGIKLDLWEIGLVREVYLSEFGIPNSRLASAIKPIAPKAPVSSISFAEDGAFKGTLHTSDSTAIFPNSRIAVEYGRVILDQKGRNARIGSLIQVHAIFRGREGVVLGQFYVPPIGDEGETADLRGAQPDTSIYMRDGNIKRGEVGWVAGDMIALKGQPVELLLQKANIFHISSPNVVNFRLSVKSDKAISSGAAILGRVRDIKLSSSLVHSGVRNEPTGALEKHFFGNQHEWVTRLMLGIRTMLERTAYLRPKGYRPSGALHDPELSKRVESTSSWRTDLEERQYWCKNFLDWWVKKGAQLCIDPRKRNADLSSLPFEERQHRWEVLTTEQDFIGSMLTALDRFLKEERRPAANQTFEGNVGWAQPQQATSPPVSSLQDVIDNGNVKCELAPKSDGLGLMLLMNYMEKPITVAIPAGQFFLAENSDVPPLIATKSTALMLPPSAVGSVAVPVVVASAGDDDTPLAPNRFYMPDRYPNHCAAALLTNVARWSECLSNSGILPKSMGLGTDEDSAIAQQSVRLAVTASESHPKPLPNGWSGAKDEIWPYVSLVLRLAESGSCP